MIHTGDCVEVMAAMEPESVDAIVTDPPYGLEFMGKEWDRIRTYAGGNPNLKPKGPHIAAEWNGYNAQVSPGAPKKNPRCRVCGKLQRGNGACKCPKPDFSYRHDESGMQMMSWHQQWAEAAYRVAKPSAYLLAFGGTRTVHRLTCALEDAGWIIRDTLVWGYASGFPKSKASLKPAWEPIVMARKPGPLRELAIDACRIPSGGERAGWHDWSKENVGRPKFNGVYGGPEAGPSVQEADPDPAGRWPANIVLTDPIFDGGWEGVVGGGWQESTAAVGAWAPRGAFPIDNPNPTVYGDSGTYSRFFLIPKADRADREPVLGGHGLETRLKAGYSGGEGEGELTGLNERLRTKTERANVHPTVKPTDLMRHLVRLVTPTGGVVLDPFLGSGTTAIAAEMEGFAWIGIEREAEYVAIAEARLNGTQRGLGLVG